MKILIITMMILLAPSMLHARDTVAVPTSEIKASIIPTTPASKEINPLLQRVDSGSTILMRIEFLAEQNQVADSQKHGLDLLIDAMKIRKTLTISFNGYSGVNANDNGNNNARHRSLKRALSMREYLLQQGIAEERVMLRAFGVPSEDQGNTKQNRVDIVTR